MNDELSQELKLKIPDEFTKSYPGCNLKNIDIDSISVIDKPGVYLDKKVITFYGIPGIIFWIIDGDAKTIKSVHVNGELFQHKYDSLNIGLKYKIENFLK